MVASLACGLIFVLSFWAVGTQKDSFHQVGLNFGPVVALILGPFIGVSVGLAKGGFACIQHVVLRFFLWLTGALPWRVIRFLNQATGSILLYRVGGGYIFAHRLLLEYFADLDDAQPLAQISSESKIADGVKHSSHEK